MIKLPMKALRTLLSELGSIVSVPLSGHSPTGFIVGCVSKREGLTGSTQTYLNLIDIRILRVVDESSLGSLSEGICFTYFDVGSVGLSYHKGPSFLVSKFECLPIVYLNEFRDWSEALRIKYQIYINDLVSAYKQVDILGELVQEISSDSDYYLTWLLERTRINIIKLEKAYSKDFYKNLY